MESDQLFFSFVGMFWLTMEHFFQTDWLILSRNFPKRQVIPVLETVLTVILTFPGAQRSATGRTIREPYFEYGATKYKEQDTVVTCNSGTLYKEGYLEIVTFRTWGWTDQLASSDQREVQQSSLYLQGMPLLFSVTCARKSQAIPGKSTIIKLQTHVGWLEAGHCGVLSMGQSPWPLPLWAI